MMTVNGGTAALLACLLVAQTAPAAHSYDFKAVEAKIREAVGQKKIPSMVVAIAKDGRIVYERAFGYADIEARVPATVDTAYRVASLSKPMTATALMVLHEKGLVDIDAPVERYMAPLSFRAYEGNPSDVTLRHLLSHTSGLSSYFQYAFGERGSTAPDFETAFKRYGALFTPAGTLMEYANLGYGLVDFIIAKRSGQTFAAFMKKEVFDPLRMRNSSVNAPINPTRKLAKGYDQDLTPLPALYNNTAGAGNAYSSAHDLMLFSRLHLSPQSLRKPILTKENVALMRSDVVKNAFDSYYNPSYYGMGFYVRPNDGGYTTMWHEGGMPGASSLLKLVPSENIAATAITNIADRNELVDTLVTDLIKVVLPAYRPEPLNATANYKMYTGEAEYLGKWVGVIKLGKFDLPCTVTFEPGGEIQISYLNTQDQPKLQEARFRGLINNKSFLGGFNGSLPADDVQREPNQILALHLIREGNVLSGRVGAFNGPSKSLQHLYPFYIRLERDKSG